MESEKTANSDGVGPQLKIIGARYVESHTTVKLWQKCIQATQGPHVQRTKLASACFPKQKLTLIFSFASRLLPSPAIGHWNTIKPRTGLTRNMPRDFITMNRGALKAGYTTAREFNLYYKAKDIRRKDDEYSRFRRSPPKVPADMTYGMPAR